MDKINTTIDASDLNGIDALNGSGSVASKGEVVEFTSEGSKMLKGALSKWKGRFSNLNARMFIETTRNQIIEYLAERFKYSGLPDELNKYRVEQKIIEDGSALFIKHANSYFVVRYTHSDFNIYDEPTIVKINEPKSDILHGKEIDLRKDGVIIRNNLNKHATFTLVSRYVSMLEKIVFQIEKNITSSAPKGIINLSDFDLVWDENKESPVSDSLEEIINSENTFFAMRGKDITNQKMDGMDPQPIYTPIELTDRTENLIKNFQFTQDKIKEIIGSLTNNLTNKKERLVSDEQNAQQGLTNATREHALEIRKIDFEKVNEMYKLNVIIELQDDERESENETDQEPISEKEEE